MTCRIQAPPRLSGRLWLQTANVQTPVASRLQIQGNESLPRLTTLVMAMTFVGNYLMKTSLGPRIPSFLEGRSF